MSLKQPRAGQQLCLPVLCPSFFQSGMSVAGSGCASWVLEGISQLTSSFCLAVCIEWVLLSSCAGRMNLKFNFTRFYLFILKGLILKAALSVVMNNNLGFLPSPLICFSPVVLSPAVFVPDHILDVPQQGGQSSSLCWSCVRAYGEQELIVHLCNAELKEIHFRPF